MRRILLFYMLIFFNHPTDSDAYVWPPSTYLISSNVLNPTFFIPAASTYGYVLEVIDQSTSCSLFDTTVMNVDYAATPEVMAFVIQPSCLDDIPQNDGYLQIFPVTNGDRYHFSADNTFDDNGNANTYANATNCQK